MAAEASFTRTRTETGAEFTVIPATASKSFVAVACIFSLIVAFSLFAISSNQRGLALLACWLGAIGVPGLLFFRIRSDMSARKKPIVLTITGNHLVVGDKQFERDDINEIQLLDPKGQPTARTSVAVAAGGVAGSAATAALAGAAAVMGVIDNVGERQIARSYALEIRRRSTSEKSVIVRYLDADTGEALLAGLADAIRTA